MGIILILAQIALIVLRYGAHAINVSPWVVWLPAILFATVWIIALMFGVQFMLDRVNPFERPSRRR